MRYERQRDEDGKRIEPRRPWRAVGDYRVVTATELEVYPVGTVVTIKANGLRLHLRKNSQGDWHLREHAPFTSAAIAGHPLRERVKVESGTEQ